MYIVYTSPTPRAPARALPKTSYTIDLVVVVVFLVNWLHPLASYLVVGPKKKSFGS